MQARFSYSVRAENHRRGPVILLLRINSFRCIPVSATRRPSLNSSSLVAKAPSGISPEAQGISVTFARWCGLKCVHRGRREDDARQLPITAPLKKQSQFLLNGSSLNDFNFESERTP
jgi:hypothetical protein